ncbi:MAG: translation elongation factor Ts [Armatimonadetes bacterium]|nr:translation elongation factor Ts [Armatimonadota bacterium]
MVITAAQVNELRQLTGCGMMDCKRALEETGGNIQEAIRVLREKGIASAARREARTATEGVIDCYVHGGGRIAVLLELNCETDFVARTDDFRNLAHELAMQVAASNPQWVRVEEISSEVLDQERAIARQQAINEGKPERTLPHIVEGRVKKFIEDNVLLEQPYIRDPKRKVKDLVDDVRAQLGENIVARRFVRWRLGEEA